jgi:hypothetical protein
MKNIITILIILFSSSNLYSQDTNSEPATIHRINIRSGIYTYYTRDEVYSPLIYDGLSVPINLEYFNTNDLRNYTIYFQYNSAKLSSSITQKGEASDDYLAHYFEFINAKLGFSYLRQIQNYGDWKLSIGGSVRNFFLYKNQHIDANTSQFGLDIFADLKIDASIQRQINDNNLLKIDISYPLVSYVVGRMYAPAEPPEKLLQFDVLTIGNILKSGDFMTVNNFVDFEFNARYYLSISSVFDLNFNYGFQYYQYPKLFIAKNAMHSFIFGLSIKV